MFIDFKCFFVILSCFMIDSNDFSYEFFWQIYWWKNFYIDVVYVSNLKNNVRFFERILLLQIIVVCFIESKNWKRNWNHCSVCWKRIMIEKKIVTLNKQINCLLFIFWIKYSHLVKNFRVFSLKAIACCQQRDYWNWCFEFEFVQIEKTKN